MCALSSILLSLCVSLEPVGVEAYNTPLLLDPDFYEPTSTKSIKQQLWLNAEHLKYTIAPVSLKGDSNSRFFFRLWREAIKWLDVEQDAAILKAVKWWEV